MKKLREKINRKSIKVITYTLLLLCALVFTSYPKSYPKYIDNDDKALVYNTKLYSLYKGESKTINIVKEGSSNTLAHFNFVFNRNDVVTDLSADTYTIELPENDKCYFGNIAITANGRLNADHSVTYKSTTDDVTIVDMYCYTDKVFDQTTKKLDLSVLIKEQIGEGDYFEEQFLYKKLIAPEISLAEYYDEIDYTEPPVNYYQLIIPEEVTNKEEVFDKWIIAFANKFASDIIAFKTETITDYVYSAYKDENGNCKDITKKIELAGLTMEYKDGNYIYTIEDNFIGYARTYNGYKAFDSGNMYFSTSDEKQIEIALNYYFDTYYWIENKEEILNYFEKMGGISALINNKIPGAPAYHEDENNIVVGINSNILDYSYIPESSEPLKIDFGEEFFMERAFFNNILNYFGDIVSQEGFDAIDTNWEPYYDSATKNNNESYTEKHSFVDYFVEYDPTNEYYLIIKMFSDVEENPDHTYNTVEISTLRVPNKDFKVTFTNDSSDTSKLTISLSHNNADEMKQVVEYLDTYFGQNSNLDESVYTLDETGNINVTYQVIKTN